MTLVTFARTDADILVVEDQLMDGLNMGFDSVPRKGELVNFPGHHISYVVDDISWEYSEGEFTCWIFLDESIPERRPRPSVLGMMGAWKQNVWDNRKFLRTGEWKYYYCSLWCFVTDQRLCRHPSKEAA